MTDALRMNVIIPTRERSDTLRWTMKTCLDQSYERLNIIVCDNFSGDDTKEVVSSFNDTRVTYINPGKRLSMTQNWEFALEHITDGYVTILGDDDGLLPNSVSDIQKILSVEKVPAFSWLKSGYCWPNHIHMELKNQISIPLESKIFEMPVKTVLRDAALFYLHYTRTPTLYNSFIDNNVIKAVRSNTGSVLRSSAPDVYSGISLMSEMNKYLYSLRPYSVNGASSHSNGTSTMSTNNKEATKKYSREMMPEESEELGLIDGSIYSVIGESLFQAKKYCFNGKLYVSKRLILFLVVYEMSLKGKDDFDRALVDIQKYATKHGLDYFLKLYLWIIKPKELGPHKKLSVGLIRPGVVGIDASKFNVENVYDAAKVIYSLLPEKETSEYVKYTSIKKLSALVYGRAFRLNKNITI